MDDHAPTPAQPPRPEFRRVLARCGSSSVLIATDRIIEVLMPQSFTRVPGAGPEVCGLIGLRGRVLTVFDLCGLLGEGRLDPDADCRILVLKAADRVVGLAVGEVITVADGDAGAVADVGTVTGASTEVDLDRLIRAKLA